MTERDHAETDGERGDRAPGASSTGRSGAPLDEPAVGRTTLARRLRTVERALGEAEGLEFESGSVQVAPGDLDAVEERLDALCRAVRAVGECLETRERRRRTDDGLDRVRRAVEALPGGGDGDADEDGTTSADDAAHAARVRGAPNGEDGSADREGGLGDESAAEWLDRAAAGGVTPPPSG